jgi:hypothetical protein
LGGLIGRIKFQHLLQALAASFFSLNNAGQPEPGHLIFRIGLQDFGQMSPAGFFIAGFYGRNCLLECG